MWRLSFLGLLPISHQNLDGGKGEAVCISYTEDHGCHRTLMHPRVQSRLELRLGVGEGGGGGGGSCMGSKLGTRMCTLISKAYT